MTIKTVIEQMEDDLRHRNERLDVEFKAWMDISKSNREGQGKIARHIAAIANHGGGRLYFGVDDDGNLQPASEEFMPEHFKSDALHSFLKTRLEPRFQCEVRFVDHSNGVRYPMVVVPPHGPMPILARNENSHFQVYIRDIGPESIAIKSAIQWEELLKRCMRYRDAQAVLDSEEDHLSRTQSMTKAITESVIEAMTRTLANGPSQVAHTPAVDWDTIRLLSDATRDDFVDQIKAISLDQSDTHQQIANIKYNNVCMGYALLKSDFSFVTLENPHKIIRQSDDGMQKVANLGWHSFIALPNSDGPPRSRLWKIGDREIAGVEGMRIDDNRMYFGGLDYWRVYGNSVFVTCDSYREDYILLKRRSDVPFLTAIQVFIRLHSILAHAALTVAQVHSADKIAIFTDHVGLKGRYLEYGFDQSTRTLSGVKSPEDRYPTKLVVGRSELLEDYFGTLKRLCVPFLELWAGNFVPEEWFTEENISGIVEFLNGSGTSVSLLTTTTAASTDT